MSSFFDALTKDQREALNTHSVPKRYNKGETVYSVGMGGSSAFFIETGIDTSSIPSVSIRPFTS